MGHFLTIEGKKNRKEFFKKEILTLAEPQYNKDRQTHTYTLTHAYKRTRHFQTHHPPMMNTFATG